MATSKLGIALALALAGGCVAGANAQTIGYDTRTGDVWVDNRLGEINDYGRQYRDPFIGEMTSHYGAPRNLVLELLDQRGWSPGDVYYACAIASVLNLPCLQVVSEYDRDPGQGWGKVAQRLGIKPGSAQFHALKRGAVNTYDRWGYPIALDSNVRVDWSQHGPGRTAAGGRAKTKAAARVPHMGHASGGREASPAKGNGGGKGNAGRENSSQGNSGKGNSGKGPGRP